MFGAIIAALLSISNPSCKYNFTEEGEHTIMIKLNTDKLNSTSFMFEGINNLESIIFTELFNWSTIYNTHRMFKDSINIKSISFYNQKEKKIVDLSFMFENCKSLISLNFTGFVTRKTKNISYMFSNCSSLKYMDLSSFDTINIRSMNGLFNGCSSLISVDLISFETFETTTMQYMFSGCFSLTSINYTKD